MTAPEDFRRRGECRTPAAAMKLSVNIGITYRNKAECAKRAAKKIVAKLKGGRPTEAILTELIAGEFEELTR